MFYKSPLSAKVLNEGLLHNIGRCFDIVFPQLEVIPKTRNKFVEIVAVAERYVIVTHVKKIKNQRSSRSEYAFLQ